MGRAKALKLNMLSGWLLEFVTFVSGLILPRLILTTFGSSCNGMVGAISQFLGFSAVLRAGVGGVTRAALFKPLAENNVEGVSAIMAATQNYMRKIGLIVAAYVVVLGGAYCLVMQGEFDWWYKFAMLLVIGAGTFADNFFGIKYKILLQADQKYYIQTMTAVISAVAVAIVSVVLILLDFPLLVVKIGSTCAVLLNPLLLSIYVKKHYHLNLRSKADNSAIKQRWDAFVQQLAIIINHNVDLVLLTFFVPLKEISVYTVHYMVSGNVEKVVNSMVSGLNATFGSLLANKEEAHLKKTFSIVEWGLFSVCVVVFSTTAVMLTPFVELYTQSVTDVNYIRPLFAFAMTLVALMNSMRLPYQLLTEAAGHFKQTRNGSILEVVLNVGVSLIMLYFFGIIGVIIGTFVAALVRTTQFAVHAMKHILKLSLSELIKSYGLAMATFLLIVGIFQMFPIPMGLSIVSWVFYAALVFVVATIITGLVGLIFHKEQLLGLKPYLMKKK